MLFLLIALLLVSTVIYVAYPLLREDLPPIEEIAELSERDGMLAGKDDVIAALKDIEMDYRMGKLSEQDYQDLKSEFERRAIDLLRDLDRLETPKQSKEAAEA